MGLETYAPCSGASLETPRIDETSSLKPSNGCGWVWSCSGFFMQNLNSHHQTSEEDRSAPGTDAISFEITRRGGRTFAEAPFNPLLGIGGVMLLFLFLWCVSWWGAGKEVIVVILCAVVIVAIVIEIRRRKPKHPVDSNAVQSLRRIPGARLLVRGTDQDVSAFVELTDAPFEPIIVGVYYAKRHLIIGLLIGLCLCAGAPIFFRWVPRPLNPGMFCMIVGTVIAIALQQLFPVYYRIVPGRMDVMESSLFTSRARVVDWWPLKTARIEIDFKKRRIELRDVGDQRLTIWIPGVTEPYRLAVGLIQAAISTHEPAPLPDDRLLG